MAKKKKLSNQSRKDIVNSNARSYNVQRIHRFVPAVYGFPDSLMTTLRYHTNNDIQSVLGAKGEYQFRWNSTFDPDVTSAGHQPLYRDLFAQVYDQYAVVSARAFVQFVNRTTAAEQWLVGLVTDDDTTTTSTGDTLVEQSHSFTTLLTPSGGSHSYHVFRVSWDCMKFLAIDPYTSLTYKTAVGSNPTEQSILSLQAYNISAPASSFVNTDVILEMDVLWTELSTPSQS
jgi:hypothetical protein